MLGVRGGSNNTGFGNLVSLRKVTNSTSTNNKVPKPTRTIKISEQLFGRFVVHSRRYYNAESYETILENLLKCYEEHNQVKHWYNTNR